VWPFRKKEDEYYEGVISEAIPVSTLIRWYLYDMSVDDANDLAKEFNLTPVSSEGDSKEKEDSAERVEDIMPLMPFVQMMSQINSKSIYHIQRKELISQGMAVERLDDEQETMIDFYENVSFAAIVASFSAAAKLGLITVNGTFTDVSPLKGLE
jgi:hypothetical protein